MLNQCRSGHKDLAYLKKFRYAHRGLYNNDAGVPENTLPAFQRAVEYGFGAELDVHLTADKQLVVVHDSDLRRLCGKELIVEDLTMSQLRECPILGTAETPPLFEDVLKVFEGKTPLIVEIKTYRKNHAEVTPAVCAMLDRYNARYCIESFDPFCVGWLKKNRPEICRGQLSENFGSKKEFSPILRYMLTNLMFGWLNCPDFIAYKFADRSLGAVDRCRKKYGVQEVSWTLRTPEDLNKAEAIGSIPIFERFIPAATPGTEE